MNVKFIRRQRHHIVNDDTDFNTQHTDKINNSFSQQLRDAEVTILRLHNLQQACLLK